MKFKKTLLIVATVTVMVALLIVPALADTGSEAAEILESGFAEIAFSTRDIIISVVQWAFIIITLVVVIRFAVKWMKNLIYGPVN